MLATQEAGTHLLSLSVPSRGWGRIPSYPRCRPHWTEDSNLSSAPHPGRKGFLQPRLCPCSLPSPPPACSFLIP